MFFVTSRQIQMLLAFFFVFHAFSSVSKGAEKPLNVVLILVDDMGWMDLSCQGSRYYQTPNVDRLAKEGMRFTNGYAACAVCSPTRAAVMTGRYPARIGVTDWIRARFQRGGKGTPKQNPTAYVGGKRKLLCPPNPFWMEHEEVTIAEMLKAKGYVSCHIGKWHLGDPAWYPEHQGFDVNIAGCDLGQPPSYFDPYTSTRYKFDAANIKPRKTGEYLTDREGDDAASFIKKNKDRPFFLYMAHYAVHTPIQARADLTKKYEAKAKQQDTGPQKNAKYAAMVHSVDDACGKIMKSLKDAGVDDRTLVIFTSDNGGLRGPTHNAPLRSGKGFPFEGGIRVPFIVRWPSVVKAGTVSDEPVMSIDLLPTIAAATGVSLPKDRSIDGLSLVPVLSDADGDKKREGEKVVGGKLGRTALYWHFPHYRHSPGPYSIVREGDWKLIKYYEGKKYLFNLAKDLEEANDLSVSMPDKVAALEKQLMSHLKSVQAKLPRANPNASSKTKSNAK
jgi:arylsulfatase A